MKSVILLVLIFVNTSLVMAVPETNKVMRLLEGRHWELREGPFKRLGEGADQRLREIADNTSLTNYLRFRALIALSLMTMKKQELIWNATHVPGIRPLPAEGFHPCQELFPDRNRIGLGRSQSI